MTEINLTQSEADSLLATEKHRVDNTRWNFPDLGGGITIPLISANKKEEFLLDVSRGRINLKKGTFQSRARQVVILLRLDFCGPPHRNPDDAEIASPHLHVYREGWGDKWAVPAPEEWFIQPDDVIKVLEAFMTRCNITQRPVIERGLFG
ncbi:MAG: hypothetical protein ABI821_17375 [Pseudomonadota bacterium]